MKLIKILNLIYQTPKLLAAALLFLFTISFAISAGTTYLYISHKKPQSQTQSTNQIQPISEPLTIDWESDELKQFDKKTSYNFLLLGYGGAGHSGGGLSDVLILVHLDTINKKIAYISIPRDLWVNLSGIGDRKINAAFALGSKNTADYPDEEPETAALLAGGNAASQAVSSITGLPVDYFAAVSFFGFQGLIDELKGITVDVPVGFTDQFYPIRGRELELCGFTPEQTTAMTATMSGFTLERQFKCRYEELVFNQGPTQMNGETALKFTRSRHSNQHGGDFARSQRQQALLTGIKNKLISLDALTNPVNIYQQITKTVQTNLDLEATKAISTLITSPEEYQTINIGLSTENVLKNSKSSAGAFILISKTNNWQSVADYIQQQLNK